MNFKLFSALALLSIVAAQSDSMSDTMTGTAPMPMPSGGGGAGAIPACLETCIGQSGCTITDVDCLCNKNVETITSCVTSTCSDEDQQTAAGLQSNLCPAGGSMSDGMNSTMVTGSATTMGANSTSAMMSTSVSSVTRTTPVPTMTPRPSNTPSSSSSAASASSTNAAVSQNMVTQGVWVLLASLIGVAVAA